MAIKAATEASRATVASKPMVTKESTATGKGAIIEAAPAIMDTEVNLPMAAAAMEATTPMVTAARDTNMADRRLQTLRETALHIAIMTTSMPIAMGLMQGVIRKAASVIRARASATRPAAGMEMATTTDLQAVAT